MKSHIINGHYMFGNTFIQPEMPMYDRIIHHNMAPAHRRIPPYPDLNTRPVCPGNNPGCCLCFEDAANRVDTPFDDSQYTNTECEDCPFCADNSIIRDPLMYNMVNIETSIIKTLKVTLYGISKEQDKTINMTTGNRYAVTYITEHGLITSVGRLEYISESVPDTCTRYINSNNMAAVSTAYIGMDCSSEGYSDKRKIYIATIRYIQAIDDDTVVEEVETVESVKERLQKLLDAIESGELVFCNKECCSTDLER